MIEATCENCEYEYEDTDGTHCRHCIHNATECFKPKIDVITAINIRNNIIDDFTNTLTTRLSDAIYKKDIPSVTNLINEIAEEMKRGVNNDY